MLNMVSLRPHVVLEEVLICFSGCAFLFFVFLSCFVQFVNSLFFLHLVFLAMLWPRIFPRFYHLDLSFFKGK